MSAALTQHRTSRVAPSAHDPREVLYVREYTATPGGRYPSDGKFPGSEFLEHFLAPAYDRAVARGVRLLVDLDGTAGYASSFLEEAFGGLSRRFGSEAVESVLSVKTLDEPYLEDDIWLYVSEAKHEPAR